ARGGLGGFGGAAFLDLGGVLRQQAVNERGLHGLDLHGAAGRFVCLQLGDLAGRGAGGADGGLDLGAVGGALGDRDDGLAGLLGAGEGVGLGDGAEAEDDVFAAVGAEAVDLGGADLRGVVVEHAALVAMLGEAFGQ